MDVKDERILGKCERLLEVLENLQNRIFRDFNRDKRDRTADLLNAIGPMRLYRVYILE